MNTENAEIWKPIKGFEELYHVSNYGRVKSLNYNHTKQEKIRRPFKDKDGYLKVVLYKDKKTYTFQIHRLVAQAFIDNPLNLPCVNHINEVKADNRSENLEYCDNAYNNNYGTRNERIAKSNTNNPNTSKVVLQYSLDGNLINEFPSTKEVQRQLGFGRTTIGKCCLGKYKTAYGFKWLYKED